MQRSPEMFRDAQSRQMEQRNAIHYIDRCRRAINNRGLQIGVRVQDRVRVRLSNFHLMTFPELSLLPVADQLKRRLSVRDWGEM